MDLAGGGETADAQARAVWSGKQVRKKKNNRNNKGGIRVLFKIIKLLMNKWPDPA
jgi:hypothetical protein